MKTKMTWPHMLSLDPRAASMVRLDPRTTPTPRVDLRLTHILRAKACPTLTTRMTTKDGSTNEEQFIDSDIYPDLKLVDVSLETPPTSIIVNRYPIMIVVQRNEYLWTVGHLCPDLHCINSILTNYKLS